VVGGLEGQVVESPLADWAALDAYRFPDVLTQSERGTRNWPQAEENVRKAKEAGHLTWGDGERLFDRLYFLRGFENLMLDFATADPRLDRLVRLLTDYELGLVRKWLAMGVDVVGFHTDIGHQQALMISPAHFRRQIKPMFAEIFGACRDAGALVYLSSDGCLLEIVDDLIECGVCVHDPQVRANTLDGIARAYKGRLCANVDLDRQMFRFCTPDDIWRQVEEAVRKVGSPDGGIMLAGSVWDAGVPLANIEALCASMEQFRLYFR
jgi:uroporphyrinogen decarboxylase